MKQKLVTETSEAPSPAKRSKAGKVVKKQTKKSSLRLVDEFVNEGVPENEPRIGDEEVDLQKAVKESLKEFHSSRQGLLPPVVIREPESGKFQPLPKVQGKGMKFIMCTRCAFRCRLNQIKWAEYRLVMGQDISMMRLGCDFNSWAMILHTGWANYGNKRWPEFCFEMVGLCILKAEVTN
ncbi:hypothetical protein Tco_1567093 [Tanacetum coccineum]